MLPRPLCMSILINLGRSHSVRTFMISSTCQISLILPHVTLLINLRINKVELTSLWAACPLMVLEKSLHLLLR